LACLVAETVLTFMFLMIILGATDRRAPQGFAPLAIGLGLTLIHLIGIPVTNVSVNPARSTGPAIFVGGWAVQQLWLFWLAPILDCRHRLPRGFRGAGAREGDRGRLTEAPAKRSPAPTLVAGAREKMLAPGRRGAASPGCVIHLIVEEERIC
jgi:hypothetical protein